MEDREGIEDGELIQKYYNYAQICLIKYMLAKGIIKDVQEYNDNYAEAFSLLASGELRVSRKVDWNKMRRKVEEITEKITGKIKNIIL